MRTPFPFGRLFAFALCLLFTPAWSAPAPVNSWPSNWRHFSVGILKVPDVDGYAHSALFGVELPLGGPLTLDGELGYVSTLRKGDTGAGLVSLGFGLHYRRDRAISPFVAGGGSAMAVPMAVAAGPHLAAGFRYRPSPTSRPIRFEYRLLRLHRIETHRFGVGLVF